jgi:hypothetical protein
MDGKRFNVEHVREVGPEMFSVLCASVCISPELQTV